MSSGAEVIVGAAKGAVWGTAALCGANHGVLITRESLSKTVEQLIGGEAGVAWGVAQDQGLINCQGNLEMYARYEAPAWGFLMALALGAAGTPSEESPGAAYKHTLTLADNLDGVFCSMAMYKGFSVHEYASVKVVGFTLTGQAGGALEASFEVIANDRSINTTTGINTTTTTVSITAPSYVGKILFRHAVFRINEASGGALADIDAVKLAEWQLTFKRGITVVNSNQQTTDEPTNDGEPEASMRLTFPEYTTDAYLEALGSGTPMKFDATFTGGLITGAYYQELYLECPRCVPRMVQDPNVDGASRLQDSIEFNLRGATAAPSGMATTKPFLMTLQNTYATDLLA